MVSINKRGVRTATPKAGTPLKTVAKNTVTFEGAPASSRDATSDLFLMSVAGFYGEDTFYEKGSDRVERFKALVHQVAKENPQWMLKFVPWLRAEANIRTAAVVAAVEAAAIMRQPGTPGQPDPTGGEVGPSRQILRELFAVGRADEPAEALAYWLANYGQSIPGPIRRGIADGAAARYHERSFIKWDGENKAVTMADVVNLTHPAPTSPTQAILFKYMLDARHRPTEIPQELSFLVNRQKLLALSDEDKQRFLQGDNTAEITEMLKLAGMTWEQVSSWGKFTANTWERLIPTMGYMALLRNLRNFQEVGIRTEAVQYVVDKLSSEDEVRKSRQLPYRFLSAYIEATGAQWAQPLETALQHSLVNVPELPGRTLVLVDTSSSMTSVSWSAKSKVTPMMAGALFGVALAAKNGRADLFGYADATFRHQVGRGAGVLRETERFVRRMGEVGHGTQTALALSNTFKGHDRVVIVTDGQTFGSDRLGYGWVGDVGAQVPQDVPIYAFNLVGYKPAMLETSATRHELGGLTDHTFSMIRFVEAGQQAKWPWEQATD